MSLYPTLVQNRDNGSKSFFLLNDQRASALSTVEQRSIDNWVDATKDAEGLISASDVRNFFAALRQGAQPSPTNKTPKKANKTLMTFRTRSPSSSAGDEEDETPAPSLSQPSAFQLPPSLSDQPARRATKAARGPRAPAP